MYTNPKKVYILRNKDTKAVIKCTEKFLMSWLARGFEVLEIIRDKTLDEVTLEYNKHCH